MAHAGARQVSLLTSSQAGSRGITRIVRSIFIPVRHFSDRPKLRDREYRGLQLRTLCSAVTVHCPKIKVSSTAALPSVQSFVPARAFHSHGAQSSQANSTTQSQGATKGGDGTGSQESRSETRPPLQALQELFSRLLQRLRSLQKDSTGTDGDAAFPDIRKLWTLASTQRKTLLIALSLLLISSSVSLIVPAAVGRIIDLFSSANANAFWGFSFGTVAAALVVVFGLGAAARATSNIMLELAGIRIIQGMRRQSFTSALRQDVEWADKSAGDVVSRLSVDTTIVGESLTSDIGDGLRAAVSVVAAGGMMLWISTQLTVVMLAIVPPAAFSAVFFGRYIRGLTAKTQDAVGKMTDVANERLSIPAFRTIQAYNSQRLEARRLDTEIQKIADLQAREARVTGVFYSGMGFVGNCTVLTLLAYGGSLVSKGVLSVGELTSILMYTAYLGGGLANLTSFFTAIMRGMGAGSRVFSLIERDPKIKLGVGKDIPSSVQPTLEFRGVTFAYPSRKERNILKDFNLKVQPGSSLAIVGPSGIGKSSVHALALRLYDPDEGAVLLNGTDIREFKPEAVRNIFRVVGQEPVMFDGSIRQNIAYSNEAATTEEILAAAEAANCMDFIKALPLGLETNARQLSGGQKQRIAIARALCGGINSQRIVLMDEATAALDSASEFLVNRAISNLVSKGGNTVWIIAHRLSTIQSVQTIFVMGDSGEIVEAGSFTELNRPGTRFRDLMAAQLEPRERRSSHASSNASTVQSRSFTTSARSLITSEAPSASELAPRQEQNGSVTAAQWEQLHRLAGLQPSQPTSAELTSFNELAQIVDSVRAADTK